MPAFLLINADVLCLLLVRVKERKKKKKVTKPESGLLMPGAADFCGPRLVRKSEGSRRRRNAMAQASLYPFFFFFFLAMQWY
jgi:hypothetical protein